MNDNLWYPKVYVQLDCSIVFYTVEKDTPDALKIKRISFDLLTKEKNEETISITNRSSQKEINGIVFADDLKVNDC